MKRSRSVLAGGLSSLILLAGMVTAASAGAASLGSGASQADSASPNPSCPWLDQSLTVQQRVGLLLPKMTLADKVDLMEGHNYYAPNGAIGYTDPIPSLCVPIVTEEDGPAGVADGVEGATQLPAPVNDASTWDPSEVKQYGEVMGNEEWAKGNDVVYGPTINIDRDPRWGRNFESLSEDPYLTGTLAAAEIQGIQSQGPIAEVKHYIVYNQETNRNTPLDDDIVSTRAIHEIYMPGFYSAVTKGDAGAVMCSYSSPNGTYACQNSLLSVLENDWGWQGFVGSDYGATHSTVAAANAGLDQEQDSSYFSALPAAVESGQVSMATINEAVTRILTEMFRFGLFNHQPSGTESTDASTPAHIAFAQQDSEEGTVLLKDSDNILPLTSSVSSIAVIGADGSTDPLTAGGGSASVNPSEPVVSPLQGIQAAAPAGTTVTSYSGTDPAQAAATAEAAQVAIVFASNYESEGSDLSNITLQNDQNAYIEAVAAANPNTIVVLNTGGPVTMPWLSKVKSVLEAWYPGQEDGNALAALLFGTADPSGHLTETFPKNLSQVPASTPAEFPGVDGTVNYSEGILVGYRWYDAKNITPLFPFGYGLSYAKFAYSNLKVTAEDVKNAVSGPDSASGQGKTLLTVSATVTNTSTKYAGADVAQLYLGDPAAAHEPPRQLKGFQKVYLQPGQSTTVSFPVTGHDLSYWTDTANGWVLPDGTYKVFVGDSSALTNLPLRGAFTVTKSVGSRYATATASASTVAPDSTITVNAKFVNNGDYAMTHAQLSVKAPKGFTATLAGKAPSQLAPHQTVTATFDVQVPESAQDTTATLTPQVTYQQAGMATTQTLSASATVTVKPLVTVSVSPSTVTENPGSSAQATLTFTSNMPHNVNVTYTATPPSGSGLTAAPATETVTVPPGGTSTSVTVTTSSSTTGGTYQIPVTLTATDQGQTYTLPTGQVQVTVPYASVAAAYDDPGISDNSATSVGNFDGAAPPHPDPAHPGCAGDGGRRQPDLAQRAARPGRQRHRRGPDHRPVRLREQPGPAGRLKQWDRLGDPHDQLHRRHQPAGDDQRGRLVRQRPRHRRAAPHQHRLLERDLGIGDPAGQRLLEHHPA
jgi:beta-glucosidase